MKSFILSSQVGTTGFEPATSCTPCKRATGLRYVPKPVSANNQRDANVIIKLIFKNF